MSPKRGGAPRGATHPFDLPNIMVATVSFTDPTLAGVKVDGLNSHVKEDLHLFVTNLGGYCS